MKKFEHMKVKLLQVTKANSQQLDMLKFNAYGEDGWEFIGIFGGECVFKREIA